MAFAAIAMAGPSWALVFGLCLWHIRGSADGLQGTFDPLSTATLVLEPSKGATICSALKASRCVYVTAKPRKGLKLRVGDCSEGKLQPARFQFPEGNRGSIKLVEDPTLCLNHPGPGILQLWSCNANSNHLDFKLHSEPSGWIGAPHYDYPNRDAEHMDTSDLKAVTKRAEELGYAGFSEFRGRGAYIKKVNHLTIKELKYMGINNPNVFYFRRNHQSGDVSIRPAASPDICMFAPSTPGESVVGVAPCNGPQSAIEGAWSAGMVFRVQGTAKPSTEKENTPPPAPEPAPQPAVPSKGRPIFSASKTSRCAYFTSKPRKGLKLRFAECSEGKRQPARFQFPEGNRGPIKLAEDPSFCLNHPGPGILQLWSCNANSKHLDFTLHSEPSGWIAVPHFDVSNKGDAEHMDASDVKAVTKRAEELGYDGFSVCKGRAILRKVRHITVNELTYMGEAEPCVFYVRRNHQSGDVSIRLAASPDVCMLAASKPGESVVGMAPCTGPQSAIEGAWTAGMVFRLKDDTNPSIEKESTPPPVPTTTPPPAPKPTESTSQPAPTSTPPPVPKPAATPSPLPAPIPVEDEDRAMPWARGQFKPDKETNNAEHEEGTGKLSRLIILLDVENVDYAKLTSNPPLDSKFRKVIQDDLSTMTGLGPDNVEVALGPGSVRANATLSVPETRKSEDVRSKLKFDALNENVARKLESVEGISDAAQGKITVASHEVTAQVGQRSVTNFFMILALLVVLVLVIGVVLGTVFCSMVKKSRPPQTNESKEAEEGLGEQFEPHQSTSADISPDDNGGFDDLASESDRLMGEQSEDRLSEPLEEDEQETPGFANIEKEQANEEAAHTGDDSQPPAEEDPDMEAAIKASMVPGASSPGH